MQKKVMEIIGNPRFQNAGFQLTYDNNGKLSIYGLGYSQNLNSYYTLQKICEWACEDTDARIIARILKKEQINKYIEFVEILSR